MTLRRKRIGACNADCFHSVGAYSALSPADCLFPDMENFVSRVVFVFGMEDC